MTTLITFLGRTSKREGAYPTTRYQFPDGQVTRPVAFFGWALQTRVQADRLVILGTAGSMWDHLFEGDLALGDQNETDRLALMEAVEKHQVEKHHLTPLLPLLSERLGCQTHLELIPYCRDEAEQVALLRVMANHIRRGETVHLDVTHGFRHLPMLAVLSALHLRLVKQARIEGIWYGAYDKDANTGQVHNLAGLLRIADWLQALATYDKDGDYGVFAPLLGESGALLHKAAFFERTTNPVKARQTLSSWKDRHSGEDPAFDLFREELHRRIAWYRRPTRPEWEKALAWRHLDQGDYLRAAIFGLEALISLKTQELGGDLNDYGARKQAHEWLKAHQSGFSTLNDLRNAMAHGLLTGGRQIKNTLEDENRLATTLRHLFEHMLGQP